MNIQFSPSAASVRRELSRSVIFPRRLWRIAMKSSRACWVGLPPYPKLTLFERSWSRKTTFAVRPWTVIVYTRVWFDTLGPTRPALTLLLYRTPWSVTVQLNPLSTIGGTIASDTAFSEFHTPWGGPPKSERYRW